MLKTLLGRCIYESESGFRVYQNFKYRWLTLGTDALQTLINRRYPNQAGLEYIPPLIKMVTQFPGDCCILGLGGAGLPHALFPILPNAQITAVDNNQEVIDIARRYFRSEHISNLTTIHQNAANFVQSTSDTYQHMIIDLYNGCEYPCECNNKAFITYCKALLKPEGILAINLINIEKEKDLFQYIRNEFNHWTLTVPIKGTSNTIVFAYHLVKSNNFLDKIQSMSFVKKLHWDARWGIIGEIS